MATYLTSAVVIVSRATDPAAETALVGGTTKLLGEIQVEHHDDVYNYKFEFFMITKLHYIIFVNKCGHRML